MAIELEFIAPTISLQNDWIVPGSHKPITLNNSPPSQKLVEHIGSEAIKYVFVYLTYHKKKKVHRTEVGVLCEAKKGKNNLEIILEGLWLVRSLKKIDSPHYEMMAYERYDDEPESISTLKPYVDKLRDLFLKFLKGNLKRPNFNKATLVQILPGLKIPVDQKDLERIVWKVVGILPISNNDYRILFLSSNRLSARILVCIGCLENILGDKLSLNPAEAGEQLTNLERDFRENPELAKRFHKFLEIKDILPDDARKVIVEDFERLKILGEGRGPSSADYSVFINHVDFFLSLPWNKENEQEKSIENVKNKLDDDIAGQDSVKQRIGDYIAPKMLNPKGRAGILCFVGPPGVGKTYFGASIAQALNRKFIRMSLGGVSDEAEIRGHRRTYIGALPGKVLQYIKQCESKNPVFVFDEIDKMERSSRGDPSAALLEVLDPEQNHSFTDHYLDAGFDLSQVFFICTANVEHDIPPALRDRMDIIRLPGYLETEKLEIAKKFLVPKALVEVGLTQNDVKVIFPDEVILKIIREYTREAGVRDLARRITQISRKNAGKFLQHGGSIKSIQMNPETVESFLGPPKHRREDAKLTGVGVAIGLAWTPYGGEILRVQSRFFPAVKKDEFTFSQTGLQKEVMLEANKAALTIVRNKTGQKEEDTWLKSIHLHIPEGAIPKDGPSAGITTLCSLYSLFTRKIAKPFLAMTGEIDLEENILPIGGVKEKVIAAMRAGIKEVMLPSGNEPDLHDVPKEIKDSLKFIFVSTVDEALNVVFGKENKEPSPVS